MSLEFIRLLRNILLRTFLIGFAFALLMALVIFGGWDLWMGWAVTALHADEMILKPLIFQLFTSIRFYLVFLVLAPALALHWTLKSEINKKRP